MVDFAELLNAGGFWMDVGAPLSAAAKRMSSRKEDKKGLTRMVEIVATFATSCDLAGCAS